jgi:hypothetical protein
LERLRETSEVFIFNNTEKQEVFKVWVYLIINGGDIKGI